MTESIGDVMYNKNIFVKKILPVAGQFYKFDSKQMAYNLKRFQNSKLWLVL